MVRLISAFVIICSLAACRGTSEADLLVYNAQIYTVDTAFSIGEAMVVKDGKILAVGSTEELTRKYYSRNKINAQGKFVYPGFIDAHAHFYRYGLGLQTADLVGTTSWEQILTKLDSFSKQNTEGWLVGRGWDQNDWGVKEYPTKERLDQMFPTRPVLLTRTRLPWMLLAYVQVPHLPVEKWK
jgi:predicted amidohydrolase YtcJ